MTQKQFNELPMLLTAAQMREVTGLDKQGLTSLRESNPGLAVSRNGRRRWLYKKQEVAKLCGMS